MDRPLQLVLPLAAVAGALLYSRWMSRRARGQMNSDEGRAAVQRFFETTGYKYRMLVRADAAAQTAEYQRRLRIVYGVPGSAFELDWVRDFDGTTVAHRYSAGSGGTVNEWTVALDRPPRVKWRALSLEAADDSAGADGHRIRPADAQLAARIRVDTADSQDQVDAVLAAPGLKEALLSCAYVDLTVGPAAATFRDPGSRNGYAAIGGYFGSMLSAGNVYKSLEVMAPIHDNIADLMVRAIQASA